MRRHLPLVLSLAVATAAISSPLRTAGAQQVPGPAADTAARAPTARGGAAPCSYDVCALRLEEKSLLAGREGREVARLGLFTAPLEGVQWRADSARANAEAFSRGYARGRVLKTIGVVTAIAGTLYAAQLEGDQISYGTWVAVTIVSSVFSFSGDRIERGARRRLARAIWWENRELGR